MNGVTYITLPFSTSGGPLGLDPPRGSVLTLWEKPLVLKDRRGSKVDGRVWGTSLFPWVSLSVYTMQTRSVGTSQSWTRSWVSTDGTTSWVVWTGMCRRSGVRTVGVWAAVKHGPSGNLPYPKTRSPYSVHVGRIGPLVLLGSSTLVTSPSSRVTGVPKGQRFVVGFLEHYYRSPVLPMSTLVPTIGRLTLPF